MIALVAEPGGAVSGVADATSAVGSVESVGSVLSPEPGVGGLAVGLAPPVSRAARAALLAAARDGGPLVGGPVHAVAAIENPHPASAPSARIGRMYV
jgi:hypothetical protein